MKVYVVVMGSDYGGSAVLRVFQELKDAESFIKEMMKEDKNDGYKKTNYQPKMNDMFLKKYTLIKSDDLDEEEMWYEIWEEEVL